MKRQKFEIRCNNSFLCEKFAWNASIREIEKAARAVALENNVQLVLVDSYSSKDEGETGFSYGYRHWVSQDGKISLNYTIQKVE